MNDAPFFGDYGFVPPPVPPTPSILPNQSTGSSSNIGWIFFILIMILGFISLVIYYFIRQKTKDEMYVNPLNQSPQDDLNSRNGGRRWITPGGQTFFGD